MACGALLLCDTSNKHRQIRAVWCMTCAWPTGASLPKALLATPGVTTRRVDSAAGGPKRQYTSAHLLLSRWLPVPLAAPAPAPGTTQASLWWQHTTSVNSAHCDPARQMHCSPGLTAPGQLLPPRHTPAQAARASLRLAAGSSAAEDVCPSEWAVRCTALGIIDAGTNKGGKWMGSAAFPGTSLSITLASVTPPQLVGQQPNWLV